MAERSPLLAPVLISVQCSNNNCYVFQVFQSPINIVLAVPGLVQKLAKSTLAQMRSQNSVAEFVEWCHARKIPETFLGEMRRKFPGLLHSSRAIQVTQHPVHACVSVYIS